jgi:hypothetical protein
MQQGHGHAARARSCRMDVHMQHERGLATYTWACSMDVDMQLRHVHASYTWTCTIDMQNGRVAWARIKDMQIGQAASTWTH